MTSHRGDRPTLHPGFDMEAYARESEARMRAVTPASGVVAVGDASIDASDDLGDDEAEQVYWACLGRDERVPVLARPVDELLALPRSAVEGFIVSCLDGRQTTAQVVAASGLPTLVALIALYELLERGLIVLRDAR